MTQRPDYPPIGLYIDGEWIHDRPSCGQVIDPATEEVLSEVPKASKADLTRALDAAARGFVAWRDTPVRHRVRILKDAVARMRARMRTIATILTLENGKPLAQASAEMERSLEFLEWDIGQAERAYGVIVPGGPGMQKLVLRRPVGPVYAATPWNGPMGAIARKTGAALAAGCSLVLKAAEETPGTACEVVRCFDEAGLPAGVLNLVLGDAPEISSTMIASPTIRMVTFTGSVRVGRSLAELSARALKPVLLELGGHAPVVVGRNVRAAEIARLAAVTKTRAAGQICTSPTRFIVHREVYEQFVQAFAAALAELRVGNGIDPGVDVGPVANARRLAAVQALIDDARSVNARVVTGGHRLGTRGYFFAPTLLADVPPTAAVMNTEPFGPVAACVPAADLDEAIRIANALPLGLAAYAFTDSLDEAEQLSRRLECGMLSVNHFDTPGADTPFGGVGDSGLGREGGPFSLDAYMVTKTILQRTSPT